MFIDAYWTFTESQHWISRVGWWTVHFNIGGSDFRGRPYSVRSYTAVTSRMKSASISSSRQIGANNQLCPLHRNAKSKALISRVSPEMKTNFLLHHDSTRPNTMLKTMEYVEEFGWPVLPHPWYSPALAPSDLHLFWSMMMNYVGNIFLIKA